VLRRAEATNAAPDRLPFTSGDLKISFAQRQVMVRGSEVKLTPTEFSLLQELVLNDGKVLTHTHLLQKVWGPEYRDEKEYLHEFVRRLRNKIEADRETPKYIISIAGVGYQFKGESSDA
jgi:two-component system KDP operon response regulator KdpE